MNYEDVNWIYLAYNSIQNQDFWNMVMKSLVS
jgi:hypothetical protein